MGHRADYYPRLEVKNKKVVLIVKAHYKNSNMDVMQKYEDGTTKIRNINYSAMGGWVFNVPKEKYKSYYYGYNTEVQVEKWYNFNNCNLTLCEGNLKSDIEKVVNKLPELKYLLNKYKGDDYYQLLKIIHIWREHPQIETLVEQNLLSLATNENLWKLSKSKQNEIINFIKQNECQEDTKLIYIQKAINQKLSLDVVESMYRYRINDYQLYKYIKKLDPHIWSEYARYTDYIEMCKVLNKDINDDYWKFPSNFHEQHQKIIEEKKAFDLAQLEEKNKQIDNKIYDLFKKHKKYNIQINVNEYTVYMPKSLREINEQAEKLSQCLISCNYYEKYANKKCILVFIKKGDVPVATAELNNFKEKKIIQFYGNEADRSNCKPSSQLNNVLNQYLLAI